MKPSSTVNEDQEASIGETKMKKLAPFAAILAVLLFAAPVIAGPPFYNLTVSATSTNTVVTPTAANGRPTSVIVQNDGASDVFVDFDRVAVASSTTAIRLKACAQVEISVDSDSFTTMGVVTASGTSTTQITAHYLKGTYPTSTSVDRRVLFSPNPNCSTATTLPANGAAVASATALPAPTGQVFHVTGTTTITSVVTTGLTAGSVFTIIFDGVLTFTDGSNLILAGNFVTTADDTITLAFDGTNLYEVARAIN